MRVAVVGANGFLGSHMVDSLVTSGHEVIAVDRFSSPPRFIHTPHLTITTDDPGNSGLVTQLPTVDAVIDVLGASTPLLSAENPRFDEEVTLPRTKRLIDACVRAGVGHYYFASTGGAIYGDTGLESNSEDTPPSPLSPYGQAKLAVEAMLEEKRLAGDLDSTVWRLSNPYGPRQNPANRQGFIAIALHHVLSGTPIPVMGPGDMVRDYLYIDDAISMASSFLGRDTNHRVYNIGSGVGVSVNEVLDVISSVVGRDLSRTTIEVPEGFVQRSVVSTNRFTSEFGSAELTRFTEGIGATWRWIQTEAR